MPSSLLKQFILYALDYISKRTRFQWNHFIANPNKFIRISVTQKVSSSEEFIELLKKFQFKKWNTSKLSFELFQFQIIWNFFFQKYSLKIFLHEEDFIYISKSQNHYAQNHKCIERIKMWCLLIFGINLLDSRFHFNGAHVIFLFLDCNHFMYVLNLSWQSSSWYSKANYIIQMLLNINSKREKIIQKQGMSSFYYVLIWHIIIMILHRLPWMHPSILVGFNLTNEDNIFICYFMYAMALKTFVYEIT